MTIAELLPKIQALPRMEKLELLRLLADDLVLEERLIEPLPVGFPPAEDNCPYTAEELARSRSEPGIYTLADIWRKVGRK